MDQTNTGFQHEALIYQGADDYLAGLVPFLREGLEAGEPTLVAVGPEQTMLLEGELGGDSEPIRFLSMQEVGRNPASIIPLWRDFVDEHPGRSIRGVGEPVWAARSDQALEECHRHEGLLNVAFGGGPGWSLLCPYDADSLPGDVIERVGASHRHVRREGGSRRAASSNRRSTASPVSCRRRRRRRRCSSSDCESSRRCVGG